MEVGTRLNQGGSGLGNEGRAKVVTSVLRRVLPWVLVDASVVRLERLGRESAGGGCGVGVRTVMSRTDAEVCGLYSSGWVGGR